MVIADLDRDGLPDVITCDVSGEFPPCASGRITDVMRNKGAPVESLFAYESDNLGPLSANNQAFLKGVQDIAVLDVNNDGCLDLVIGTCNATRVWIQQDCDRACPGDITGDGEVDQVDLGVLLAHFGSSVHPGTNGDLNDDGIVNQADLGILLALFGTSCR